MDWRIGEGIDRHALVAGRPLRLGGVEIPHDRGLQGHSDGDALLHALCDALLGAGALGDLGTHFADTDDANRDRDSADFLRGVLARLAEAGYEAGNLDCTIMAEEPRLAPHVAAMRARIAEISGLELDRISVKATRGEGMGPEGRAECITVRAVALIRRSAS